MRSLRLIPLATAFAVAAFTLPGCDDQPGAPAPGPVPSPATSSPAPGVVLKAQPAAIFTNPADLCTVVKFDPVADLAGGTPVKPTGKSAKTGRITTAKCAATLGPLDKQYRVEVSAEFFTAPLAAQGDFEGFKGVHLRDYAGVVKDITGVGQAAYYYESLIGPSVRMLQGNLILEVSIYAYGGGSLPPDLAERLTKIAAQAGAAIPH